MEKVTEEIPNELKKVPRIYNNAIEKMLDEMPKDYTEMQKARYIYINLGKLLAYDERYTVGNRKAQCKLFKLAKERVIDFNEIKENKKFKGICIDLNRLYANVLRSIGIEACMNYGYGPMPHDSVTAKLDGHFYCLDLQRDLIHVQLNCKTDFFGFFDDDSDLVDRLLSDEEVEKLDESLNFKNYDYSGGLMVKKLREKFEAITFFDDDKEGFSEHMRFKNQPLKQRVEEMFKDISEIPGVKDLGYTERTRVYCQMAKHGLAYGEKKDFRIDNLYTIEKETKLPKDVVEVFTVAQMDDGTKRFSRYIYDHVNKEYVSISNVDLLKKIDSEGLKSKKELAGLRKIRREYNREIGKEPKFVKMLRRILTRVNKNPMDTDGCMQAFNADERITDEVEPEIEVDLSEKQQEKTIKAPKKPANARKSIDEEDRDY